MADIDFKFKQDMFPSEFTCQISSMMQEPLPREWLLRGRSKLEKFDATLIVDAL
jgi:hypothetical protein